VSASILYSNNSNSGQPTGNGRKSLLYRAHYQSNTAFDNNKRFSLLGVLTELEMEQVLYSRAHQEVQGFKSVKLFFSFS